LGVLSGESQGYLTGHERFRGSTDQDAGEPEVDAFVLVGDVEEAAVVGDRYPFDTRRVGNSRTNSVSREPECRSGGRVQRKWVAIVSLPPG
jgi:hypothetical protein